MKTINLNNGIHINADLFIIPNSAAKIEDLIDISRENNLKYMQKICELNGMKFDEQNDYLIETWYCSEEFECDNIPDHSIYCNTEDGQRCIIGVESRRWLPSNLFKGKKEGDTINVKIPVWVRINNRNNGDAIDAIADFTITLSQTKYRYARFGNFEEVLEKVIAAQSR